MQNYEEVLSLDDDPRFGSIKILCDSINPRNRVMKKTENFKNKQVFNQQNIIAQKRLQIVEPRIQILKDFEVNNDDLSIDFYYEYLDEFLVLKELEKEQVLKLFQHICQAIIQNQQIGQNHGDIRPEQISFDFSKDFYLLQKKDLQKDICDLQKENVQCYKPIYTSPELFERLMRHQKIQDIDISKNDLFSLGFMCLEAFEEHDFLQEFYIFNKGVFDYESMKNKLDLISKRNLPSQVQEFLIFLKHYILVDQDQRISPEEALDFILDIQEGKKLFESVDQPQYNVNENVQYYNPFDFVNTSDIIPRTVSIDNRQEINQFSPQKFDIRHRDESLIDISQNAKVHKSVGQNNILIVTQNQNQQLKSSENGCDLRDVIENLKYFKLKLHEPAIKQPNQINFKGQFYPLQNKSQQKSISQSNKKQIYQSNDQETYDYLQTIGLQPDTKESNLTNELDKKLRETAKFDTQQEIVDFDQKLKSSKQNKGITSLRGFLKNSAQEQEIKTESKIKSEKKIEKGFNIFNFKKKSKEKKPEKKKIEQRQKSARKLMMNNYDIFQKKSENNINLKQSQQSCEIQSFKQPSKKSILSEDDQSLNSSKQNTENLQKQHTFGSIEKVEEGKIQQDIQNQVQTPKRNYQPSSLQYLNQKKTTKSHKQETKKLQKTENNKYSQQNNNVKFASQNNIQKIDTTPKVVSIKRISVNGPQDLQNLKSSNFLNCYSDNYIQQCSQRVTQPFVNHQNQQQVYNMENIKERESWKNIDQRQYYQDKNNNLHLYQNIQDNSNRHYIQPQQKYYQNTQKTLNNTNIIVPAQSTHVEDRQSTKWINSIIPSQNNIQQNKQNMAYNFHKKHETYRYNQLQNTNNYFLF